MTKLQRVTLMLPRDVAAKLKKTVRKRRKNQIVKPTMGSVVAEALQTAFCRKDK